MFLNKLLLKEYGQFNNKEISLKKGFNIICGGKQSGKTTIRDFISAMIYGHNDIDRKKKGKPDRKPNNGGGYTGKAYINHNDHNYLVEKDFTAVNKKTSVMDVMTGREVPLKYNNSLQESIIDYDNSLFEEILCIDGCKGNNSLAISKNIEGYLSNLTLSGSSVYDVEAAVNKLEEKKSTLDTYEYDRQIEKLGFDLEDYDDVEDCLRVVKEKIDELDSEFALETAKRKREARKLIENKKGEETFVESEDVNEQLDELVSNSVFLNPDLLKDYMPEEKFTDKVWVILLTGLFVFGVICLMVNIVPLSKEVRQIFCICAFVIVAITIIEGMFEKGMFSAEKNMPSEEEFKRIIYSMERKQEAQDVEIDMSYAKEFMDRKAEFRAVEAEFLERQNKKIEIKHEREELIAKRTAIQREIHSINLAINAIRDISAEIKGRYEQIINSEAKDIIAKITSGKFTDIRFDDRHKLYVKSEEGFVEFANIRVEDMKPLYLAIRIALASKLCSENMPIVLDEAFVGCDRFTIINTLECLKDIPSDQIIILTKNETLKVLFDNLKLEYTYHTL